MTNTRTAGPARILGLHHITLVASNAQRTADFYTRVLGLRLVKTTVNFDDPGSYHLYFADEGGNTGTVITFFEWPGALRGRPGIGGTHHDDPGKRHWSWGAADARPGSLITYLERDATDRRASMSSGQGHHYALAVADDVSQAEFRDRLLSAGLPASPVMDRVYFRSVYTRDPDGHIVELATTGPGFLVDEPAETTGDTLRLPPWLESHRDDISERLTGLERRGWPNDGSNPERGVMSHPRAAVHASDEAAGAAE